MTKKNSNLKVLENEVQNLKEKNGEEHRFINGKLTKIDTKIATTNDKLDIALQDKADKIDLRTTDGRIWSLVLAMVVAFIGLIATAVKAFFGGGS